jgi:putative flippase GtrA
MKRRVSELVATVLRIARQRRQLLIYGIIGVSGATLDFVGYIILYKYFHIAPPIASFLSVTVGITNNYILNSRFNFKVNDNHFKRFLNFYTIGLTGAVLSAVLIAALQHFGVGPTLAKVLTIPPIVLGQYIFNKRISFGKK